MNILTPEVANLNCKDKAPLSLPPLVSYSSTAHGTATQQAELTEPVLIESQWLSTDWIDRLTEQQQDWISLLESTFVLETYLPSMPAICRQNNVLPNCRLQVCNLIALTFQAPYTSEVIAQQQYWSYTCCLQAAGLGRVRLAVYFTHLQPTEPCAVFLTNRLDWSPRRILFCWLKHHPLPGLGI